MAGRGLRRVRRRHSPVSHHRCGTMCARPRQRPPECRRALARVFMLPSSPPSVSCWDPVPLAQNLNPNPSHLQAAQPHGLGRHHPRQRLAPASHSEAPLPVRGACRCQQGGALPAVRAPARPGALRCHAGGVQASPGRQGRRHVQRLCRASSGSPSVPSALHAEHGVPTAHRMTSQALYPRPGRCRRTWSPSSPQPTSCRLPYQSCPWVSRAELGRRQRGPTGAGLFRNTM